ncbi:MAG: alkaline phosphatase PhoX [Cyanobacteria bacterium P01_G01_bin.49]
MAMKRRDLLKFLGWGTGAALLGQGEKTLSSSLVSTHQIRENSDALAQLTENLDSLAFSPVKVPIPLTSDNLTDEQQKSVYRTYEVVDDLVLPEGFTYDVIAQWGDQVGDSRFGYNNDYLSFIETNSNEGFLTINFEYISGKTWMETYEKVIGKSLPFAEIKAMAKENEGKIDVFSLSSDDPLKAKIEMIAKEGLIDQGMGVISLSRNAQGQWQRTNSPADRRITGISGLEDERYLKATGPSVTVFEKENKLGYEDGLGSKIIGTFQNCAGGTTPWGTVLSAEENIQDQVPETVMADGSSMNPSVTPFLITDEDVDGRGNVFGLAGNKYGWMVEIDPANKDDYGTKHTWLGRYRHEAVAFRAEADKKLAVYSGCDRRGGHLYKFVSQGIISDPKDKQNSRLMESGMLYGAVFKPDGTGEWIALKPETPINPVLPSQVQGNLVTLPNPNRAEGGMVEVTTDEAVTAFRQKFKTLKDLYQGNSQEQQGAILIDAHFAGNAVGITCTARPEDTEVASDGTLFIAFTSGTPGGDGGPDQSVFLGPNGETNYEYGWIMKLKEDNNDPSSMTFRWELLATGGEPAIGGLGFSNPDNLAFDLNGDLWMVTDMSTSKHNKEISSRQQDGEPLSTADLLGIFGNNALWYLPLKGANQGIAYPFAVGPMEVEMTGPWFSQNQQSLFLAIQHPGEKNGTRMDQASEMREFSLLTTSGQEFIQQRTVPIGSNWPSKEANEPPRPCVITIRRKDLETIIPLESQT